MDQAFDVVGEKPKAVTCPVIGGIVKRINEIASDIVDKAVLDTALIASAQAIARKRHRFQVNAPI